MPIPLAAGGVDAELVTPAAKIMIVDDDVETRLLLGEELLDLGHEAVYAADGVQALSLVRREQPDLILLDLRLPDIDCGGVAGGDGFSVLERLRSIEDVASIPVIVFSGMRSPEAEERAMSLGAREFVLKSFSGNDLVEAIARVLEGHVPSPISNRSAPLSV
jgi:CheY-like chemotaxis protein